jgi:hypothetical protein
MDEQTRRITVSFDGEQAVELNKLGFDEAIDLLEAALTLRDAREERLTSARSRHTPKTSGNGIAPVEQPRGRGRPKNSVDAFPRTRSEQIEEAEAEAAQ